jgi:hypothetical protein
MSGAVLGIFAGSIVVGSNVQWFRLLRQVRIPKDRTGFLVLNGAGALLGLVALVLGAGTAGGCLAAFAVVGGLGFLGLAAASGQKPTTPAVAVGGPILDFASTDDEGRAFDLSSLRGRPFLLKFFRGHW